MPRFAENTADGFASLEGGMSSSLSPSIIQPNQFAMGTNVTNRDGFIRTRPKYMRMTVDFQGNTDAETWYMTNPISGEGYFQSSSGQSVFVCCAGGRFFGFTVSGNGYSATGFEFTPPGNRNSKFQPITWFCQAANLLVAQNGLDIPVIFDGSSGRRSNLLANEVPVGRQMAYINDRLFVVSPDQRQIFPGDLAYSTPTSVVTFTEINQPATQGGQPLAIPLELGGITGMKVTAQTNTQAGQGVLLVTTPLSITSINPIVQRNLWPTIQLQNVAMIGNGFTSNNSAVVNGDVWGKSIDGFRSFIMAQRNFFTNLYGTQSWGNTSQSQEILRIIENNDATLFEFAHLAFFDNRLLMTVMPQAINNGMGCYHLGVVSLNFDAISSITTKSNPAYEGVWTGVNPYGFCTGAVGSVQRCFMFAYDPVTGMNSFWEITTQYGNDNDQDRIPAAIETRSFNFQSPYQPKEIQSTEVFVDEINGEVNFQLQYKPDQYPCWLPYNSWTECAGEANCSPQGQTGLQCIEPIFAAPQFRPRMDAGKPPLSCDPVLDRNNLRGYEFQLRIAWTGQARVRAAIVYANPRDVNATVKC